MESVVERFLRYVTFDTQSDEESDTCPSTEKQKALAAALVEEMHAMGIADARMDENGYVYGTVPGDPDLPTIGLIAHMDTAPAASGENVQPRVVRYEGGELALGAEFVNESFIGSRFTGRLLGETTVGDLPAVLPSITGRAWVTGMGQYLLDPTDPFPAGFVL